MSQNKLNPSEIVLSGISGRFPNSNNMHEFEHNLYNKVDMVDEDTTRWKHFHPEVPKRSGKIRNLEKFDASFFSILSKHANQMDPQCRILLEHAYEAILDAGVSPESLVGSRTGVFIGCCFSDSRDTFLYRIPAKEGWGIFGNANFYLSNRISYALGLCGPSFTVDTACSSSAYALDCAYKYIMSGACDSALVGGSQLLLNLSSTIEYTRLGILASDGLCRPFDKNASGFSRADTICVVFLQREKDSKRVYAKLVHTNSNNDGFKKEGSSFPSKVMQQKLIEEFFRESSIDPGLVNFVEAHSTGTKLGDPEEVAAIDEVFCKNKRSKPLLIGSVKSNMGHAEASSGVASIAKIILALENQRIPPNINFSGTREEVPAFAEGRIRVVTEVEPLEGPYISMNSFGLGGANAHALFHGNLKDKKNFGLPTDDLNRLVLWSGRTEEAVKIIFDDIVKRPLDVEFLALLQNSQVKTNTANVYRGYGIFSHDITSKKAACSHHDIQLFTAERRPMVWVYAGVGSQWQGMGTDLMRVPIFAETIQKCHDALSSEGIDVKKIITTNDDTIFDNVLNTYIGIAAVELGLTDVLKALGLQPDFIIGHSAGEIGVAYADGCLTIAEAMLASYSRGKASNESKNILGAMAAVGLNHREVSKILPSDIDIACHNSVDSTTISGPAISVRAFVKELTDKNIFAKEVACSGIPLHSRYIKEMGARLNLKLDEVIKNPRTRSSKWLSSCYSKDTWNTESAQLCSGEYHTKNLLSPVLFEEVLEMLPKNALTIEVAPHALLKSILKRSMKDAIHLSLTQRENKDGSIFLMNNLGILFQNGVDIDVSKLYPPVSFPVSRGTPMISPIIKWDHQENYVVPLFDSYNFYEKRNVTINLNDKLFEFVQGHIIDGKVLFPGTGWLYLVWETFSMMHGVPQMRLKVAIEEVKFLRATSLQKNQDITVTIAIHRASGKFEIIEGKSAIAQGSIKIAESSDHTEIAVLERNDAIMLKEPDFYKEMRLRGYYHQKLFRAVEEIRDDGLTGKIKWNADWTTFMDCLVQFQVLMRDTRMLILPTAIRKLIIDPIKHLNMIRKATAEDVVFDVAACPFLGIITAGGIEIHGFEGSLVNRRRPQSDPVLEVHKFVPNYSVSANRHDKLLSKIDMAKVCVQLALENEPLKKIVAIEIDSYDGKIPLCENFFFGLGDLPLITPQIIYLTSKEMELDSISIQNKELSAFDNVNLIIRSQCILDQEFLKAAKASLNGNGFIISREAEGIEVPWKQIRNDLQILAVIPTDGETIFMMRFAKEDYKQPESVININSNVEEWLEPLKSAIKKGTVLAYSQNNKTSGILGLINCIRKEPNGEKLRCVFIDDTKAPMFDPNCPFYESQLKLDLKINVLRNGQWGTYRHLLIKQIREEKPRAGHFYTNSLVKGDLSTLAWLNGPLVDDKLTRDIVRIQYASLNFRDVMLASGKINSDDVLDRIQQQSIMGFEFSGTTDKGRKVMGMGPTGAMSTYYELNKTLLWDVPDNWTLEEAATVPLVYYTVYLAFFVTSKIEKGKSILIHAGTGGVGLAAIQVALSYGLTVYTTVGNDEKKKYLLERFPQIEVSNIGNSRNTTFEKMIRVSTKGIGVDFVLNSLSEDKLQASIRCLAKNGTFLEIGKYDIMNRTKFDMGHFAKRINFRAVFFDDLPVDSQEIKAVRNMVENDIRAGIVIPLNANIFEARDVEQAFRFMASGKHIGKVLLKVRKNPSDIESLPITVLPRVYCDSYETFILVGGLGGFGLELADWLILRGCRKLVMSSSRGISNAYQESRIKVWKSYGVEIIIATADISTKAGCEQLIKDSSNLGAVGGIFNLAVALRDGIFENQNSKLFCESLAPKAEATRYLDEISRKLCPKLKHFVIFSSVSCGRGNAGQSNYGMGNSIMERIMEKRSMDGLPAKAIQWGAVGDVGLLADLQENNMDMEISGTLPQRITSCLEVLDNLLSIDEPVVASMVVAEKRFDDVKKGNIVDAVLNIMSIRDKKSISMDASLSRLGMDSLMGVEIQQILERDYDVVLSSQEMRSLTLSQLEKRVNSKDIGLAPSDMIDGVLHQDLAVLMTSFGNESHSEQTILKLDSASEENKTKVLIVPGIEGMAGEAWIEIAKKIRHPTYILQLAKTTKATSIEELVDIVSMDVLDLFSSDNEFKLIAYSFGSLIGLKLVELLEARGKKGSIVLIDGSPLFISKLLNQIVPNYSDDKLIQDLILLISVRILAPNEFPTISKQILEQSTWESKLATFVDVARTKSVYSVEYGSKMLTALIARVKMSLIADKISIAIISSQLSLVKASEPSVKVLDEDYGLRQFSSKDVNINIVEGSHSSILQNPELYDFLNL